jgi:hypothetical protein
MDMGRKGNHADSRREQADLPSLQLETFQMKVDEAASGRA